MFFATLLLCCEKAIPWLLAGRARGRGDHKPIRVLIVGAGQAGAAVAARLQLNRAYGYEVVAFLDDADDKRDRQIHGAPIVGAIETLTTVVVPLAIDLVVVAIPSIGSQRLSEILALCDETGVAVEIHSGLPRPRVSPPQPRAALPIAQQADGQGLSSVG
jgi:FlaA1/EpsC-like NDP-sugar epimerase